MSRRSAAVRDAVATIAAMSLAEMRKEWERRYGAAPRHRSAELLRRVLAWRVQADALGGFDAMTLKLLARDNAPLNLAPVAGMRLAREWAGKVHEVVVLDDGIVYAGKRWRSLSQVAQHITGMTWNGPRFFGLRGSNAR